MTLTHRAKNGVKAFLRRRDIRVTRYRYTAEAARQAMLSHYGIDLLVDVGANVGQYAMSARRHGYQGRIMSLEPLGAAFEQLRATAEGDPAWTPIRVAAGAAAGSLTLRVSEKSIFSSALPLLDAALRADTAAVQVSTEEVTVEPIDNVLRSEVYTELAVKIDVQGFERSVLEGATETLARAAIVEMELSPRPIYEGQMLMDEALERMSDAGLILSLTENLLREKSTGRSLQFNGVFVRA